MNQERKAMVHGYLNDPRDEGKPDRRTRLGLLSVAELYRNGEIDKIVFATREELSNSQVKRVKILLNYPPEEDIIVEPSAVSTEEEVKIFKDIAESNDWNNLLTIGYEVHIPRIKKEIKKTFKDKPVESLSSKDILSRYPRYSNILSDMENWPEHTSLSLQEKVLNIPIIGRTALKALKSPRLRPYKIALQSYVFKQVERYKF